MWEIVGERQEIEGGLGEIGEMRGGAGEVYARCRAAAVQGRYGGVCRGNLAVRSHVLGDGVGVDASFSERREGSLPCAPFRPPSRLCPLHTPLKHPPTHTVDFVAVSPELLYYYYTDTLPAQSPARSDTRTPTPTRPHLLGEGIRVDGLVGLVAVSP